MSKHRTRTTWWNRMMSGVLCLVLMLGLLPAAGLTQIAGAAHWADPDGEKLVEWGVISPGTDLRLGDTITRAEIVTMLNRAFGYSKLGGTPFTDVPYYEWYAEDIDVAYNAGYFKGTSADTASPLSTLTREEATVLLARCMRLQETVGDSLSFTDGHDLHDWSRGLIDSAVSEGVIKGLPDGSFSPTNDITRGEVATMLVRAIGTPVSTAGVHELGDVYGNVTINTSDVTLRDTTILGNLYLTGGVDLGNVLLENVTVLGRIIISGGGESHEGRSSVVLRNVKADELAVDSMVNQFVTVSAYGLTDIPNTYVRSNTWLEDSSNTGYGLQHIEQVGASLLQLAGSIKEVVNKTPNSTLQLVQGTAEVITIDEYATNSELLIDINTRVDVLNLDVATLVHGKGDIGDLTIGANGCVVEILPEHVNIRSGITATVNGEEIGSVGASELSSEPRLMAGYPKVANLTPVQAEAQFSGNKQGIIYYAVSELASGSVSEEDLVNNPAYGGIIYNGNADIIAAAAKIIYSRNITDLAPDGSYYLTAMLEDGRGNRSPIKVISFTTPDNTVPEFLDGRISRQTCEEVQLTGMASKSCMLYWVLLADGAAAPTAQNFKTGSFGGDYGRGSLSVVKNVPVAITVNRNRLQEKSRYVLYVWLNDFNGAQNSRVYEFAVQTPDETPPVISAPIQTGADESSVDISFSMNETGIFYWAVVLEGDETPIAPGSTPEETAEIMSSLGTKILVKSGTKAGFKLSGSVPVTAAGESQMFTIAQLLYETYKTNNFTMYYVAQDDAGNYSERVGSITIRTVDKTPPTVELDFTPLVGEGESAKPQVDSDIMLVFSEPVKGGRGATQKTFLELYEQQQGPAINGEVSELAIQLAKYIELYTVPSNGGRSQKVTPKHELPEGSDWVIDWTKAVVSMDSGKMVITLPGKSHDGMEQALKLKSGTTYQFQLKGVFDAADNGVMGDPNGNYITGLYFTTVYALVELENKTNEVISIDAGDDPGRRLDMVFDVKPESTGGLADSWDLIMWSDNIMAIDVYRKKLKSDGTAADSLGWVKVNANPIPFDYEKAGRGLGAYKSEDYLTRTETVKYETVSGGLDEHFIYRYGIHITYFVENGEGDYTNQKPPFWNGLASMRFSVIAGTLGNIIAVSERVNRNDNENDRYNDYLWSTPPLITEIGTVGKESILHCTQPFTDTSTPEFQGTYPELSASANTITVTAQLTRAGTVYWVAAPVGVAIGVNTDGNTVVDRSNDGRDGSTPGDRTYIPIDGADRNKVANKNNIWFLTGDATPGHGEREYNSPSYRDIFFPNFGNKKVKSGSKYFESGRNIDDFVIEGLDSDTDYYIYFVLVGGGDPSHVVQIYRQTTAPAQPPIIDITTIDDSNANVTVNEVSQDGKTALGKYSNSVLFCALVEFESLPPEIFSVYYDWRAVTDGKYAEVYTKDGKPSTDEPSTAEKKNKNYLTVYQAMSQRYDGGSGKTYFDMYAPPQLKSDVMNYITGRTHTTNPKNEPAARYPKDNSGVGITTNPTLLKCAPDMPSSIATYVMLACAYNGDKPTPTGEDCGFAARSPLYNPDLEPPVFKSGNPLRLDVSMAYDGNTPKPDWNSANGNAGTTPNAHWRYSFTGYITITFNKPVYHAGANGKMRVVNMSATALETYEKTNGTTKSISIAQIVGGTAARKVSVPGSAAATKPVDTETFTIYVEKINSGEDIIFQALCNGSNQTVPTTRTLRLVFDATMTLGDYTGRDLNLPAPGFWVTYD